MTNCKFLVFSFQCCKLYPLRVWLRLAQDHGRSHKCGTPILSNPLQCELKVVNTCLSVVWNNKDKNKINVYNSSNIRKNVVIFKTQINDFVSSFLFDLKEDIWTRRVR